MTRALLAALTALLLLPTAIAGADPLPTVTIADVAVAEGNGGPTAVGFVLTLSQSQATPVTVAGETLDGTAKAGEDYVADSGDVTFDPGETQITVLIDATGDTTPEADETFDLKLSNPDGATIADDRATATIRDDDPVLSARDADISEPDRTTDRRYASVVVELNRAYDFAVTVAYATQDGSATAGGDYNEQHGTLSVPAGATSKTLLIRITGDLSHEPDESFAVVLSPPTHAVLARDRATVTIHDNDPAIPAISIDDANVSEGTGKDTSARFTVSLSEPTTRNVTVLVATSPQTAGALDFGDAIRQLTFTPGETAKTFEVRVIGDPLKEPTESFTVRLSRSTNATLGRSAGSGWIHDDDPPRCIVPDVRGVTLATVKQRLWKAHCTLGRVTKRKVKGLGRGRVASASKKAGTLLRAGAKVNLVVSGKPAKKRR